MNMKLSVPFLLAGMVGLATTSQTFAAGYGATAPAYSQAGHPMTNQPNTAGAGTSNPQSLATRLSASVSISDGSKSATSFSSKTKQLSATFTTTGTNKGDKLQAVWISSVNGRKKINTTALTGDRQNFNGSVSINGPAAGWPAGKYELDLFVNNKLVAHQPFTMKQ